MPLFFAANALYYVAHGAHDVCLALDLRARGHDDAFVGLAWVVAVTSEILLMFLAPRLFARFGGPPFLVLGAAVSVIRWATFPELTSRGALLASQTLHAFTFGTWYLATVKHVQDRAPPEARSSVQAGAQAVLGAGTILGYLAGGAIFEAHGGRVLFRGGALAAALSLVMYAALARVERRRGGSDVE
jgi:PPP family 3-phenylpropionic acid transporter